MTTSDVPASTLPSRRDLPPQQCWALESIFATPEAFLARLAEIEARLAELEQYRGQLASSAATLRAGLALRDELLAELDRLRTYGVLRMSEDARVAEHVAWRDRALALQARGRAAAAFFEPEIVAMLPETLTRFCAADAQLAVYEHYFDTLRRHAAHSRSAEVEALLASAEDALGAFYWSYTALTDGDLRFGTLRDEAGAEVELRQNNRFRYLHSQQRAVRQAAWQTYADAFLRVRHTLAANFAGAVKANVARARARGYPSAIEAALARQDVPRAVFDTTLATVWRHFPLWQRYFRVRARLLGVETAQGWDISEMPIPRPDRPPPAYIPYEAGLQLVMRALEPLGDAYAAVLRRAVDERWIDSLPNAGKFSGAFSSGSYLTRPFLCLNWAGDLAAVSVLAHELGHSVHSYFSWSRQPYVYAYCSDFVAEAVSNLHQFLLAEQLLATNDDPQLLLGVLEERMGYCLRYVFTMPLLARFELDAHAAIERGDAVTADNLSAAMLALYAEGYGATVTLDHARMGIAWAMFTHLYGNFYTYQYATGLAAGASLARQIRTEGQPASDRLRTLLEAGGSADPLDLLTEAGVDMRTPAPLEAVFALMASYVDRLEQLI